LYIFHTFQKSSSSILTVDCPFPEALAAIKGNNPGWVFLDDLKNRALPWCGFKGLKAFTWEEIQTAHYSATNWTIL